MALPRAARRPRPQHLGAAAAYSAYNNPWPLTLLRSCPPGMGDGEAGPSRLRGGAAARDGLMHLPELWLLKLVRSACGASGDRRMLLALARTCTALRDMVVSERRVHLLFLPFHQSTLSREGSLLRMLARHCPHIRIRCVPGPQDPRSRAAPCSRQAIALNVGDSDQIALTRLLSHAACHRVPCLCAAASRAAGRSPGAPTRCPCPGRTRTPSCAPCLRARWRAWACLRSRESSTSPLR